MTRASEAPLTRAAAMYSWRSWSQHQAARHARDIGQRQIARGASAGRTRCCTPFQNTSLSPAISASTSTNAGHIRHVAVDRTRRAAPAPRPSRAGRRTPGARRGRARTPARNSRTSPTMRTTWSSEPPLCTAAKMPSGTPIKTPISGRRWSRARASPGTPARDPRAPAAGRDHRIAELAVQHAIDIDAVLLDQWPVEEELVAHPLIGFLRRPVAEDRHAPDRSG